MLLRGERYCGAQCLEKALLEMLRDRRTMKPPRREHRIPLGLLLLSRQQLTAENLRVALEAQRSACAAKDRAANTSDGCGREKIGWWLQELGFASEQQVTAALARQWSCPVLQTGLMQPAAARFPQVPLRLLESFRMMPVEFTAATKTLLMAFSERIDHTVLYAIEQMLGYRTEPCLVRPSVLEKSLASMVQHRGSGEVSFDRVRDVVECASIVANYAARAKAEEVRVASCGEHFWVRLERSAKPALTLVLGTNG